MSENSSGVLTRCPLCHSWPRYEADSNDCSMGKYRCVNCNIGGRYCSASDKEKALDEWNSVCKGILSKKFSNEWMQDIDLDNCPLCGSPAKIVLQYGRRTGYITCTSCGIRTRESRYIDNVLNVWNKREE